MERACICRLGKMAYGAAWSWQKELQERRFEEQIPDLLLLAEHPPTYTCGRSTQPGHLRVDAATLAGRGIAVFAVERGGSITYHGPGQLVGYPIVDLRRRGRDVHRYMRQLEEVIVRTLACFGLAGYVQPGLTGVWVGSHKIAAIGIHVRHWITMHGLALNVCPDLAPFEGILPCGLASTTVTSMAQLLSEPPVLQEVGEELAKHFAGVFGYTLEEISQDRLLTRRDSRVAIMI